MAHFPEFKRAMLKWARKQYSECKLALKGFVPPHQGYRWISDPNGTIRAMPSGVYWDPDQSANSPEWQEVLRTASDNEVISSHFGSLVGLVDSGAYLWELPLLCSSLLPQVTVSPQYQLTIEPFSVFFKRYRELENNLVSSSGVINCFWLIDGIKPDFSSLQLDANTTLRRLTPEEIVTGLFVGAIHVRFPVAEITREWQNIYAVCLSVRAGKTLGQQDTGNLQRTNLNELVEITKQRMESSMAFVGAPCTIKGFFRTNTFNGVVSSHLNENIGFIDIFGIGKVHGAPLKGRHLKRIWKLVATSENVPALKTAALRMYYSDQRNRPEDRLLDLAIAAEALFLSADSGNNQQELTYRLALRAALWSEPKLTGKSRKDVRAIIKKLYALRSRIAHGSLLSKDDLKLFGAHVSIGQVLEMAKPIVMEGLLKAMRQVEKSPNNRFEPNWEDLVLNK